MNSTSRCSSDVHLDVQFIMVIVLGLSLIASLTMLRVAEEEGRQLQPQSIDLHNSCENHPADLNVCMGNHSISVPAQPQDPPRKKLSVPKNRNRRKIAAFSNRKVLIAGFAAEIAEKSPENRRRNRRKIASVFLGRGIEIAAFPRFQIAAFSGR